MFLLKKTRNLLSICDDSRTHQSQLPTWGLDEAQWVYSWARRVSSMRIIVASFHAEPRLLVADRELHSTRAHRRDPVLWTCNRILVLYHRSRVIYCSCARKVAVSNYCNSSTPNVDHQKKVQAAAAAYRTPLFELNARCVLSKPGTVDSLPQQMP
jgi:hypothetical protein